jgi:tRNA pseudouridine55 synthase
VKDVPADFVLPVDKPEGPTSHDVVSAVRKALSTKRVGHTGTLDPFASGLLLVCVGRATRLAEYFSTLDKSYEAVARLGVRTDTLDRDGQVVAESDAWRRLAAEDIEAALRGLRGDIQQVPPAYSAKKVGGERAYVSARAGRPVELEPSAVTVRALEMTSLDLPLVSFSVTCSSGTYVRALARDLGEALGVGAHLTSLRRTAIGTWSVADAVRVADLTDRSRVTEAAVAPLAALSHLRTVEVDQDVAARLVLGQTVPLAEGVDGEGAQPEGVSADPVAISHEGALLAIGWADDGVLRPRKVFAA